jgi:predicted RNA-binding Zn-ribbon protein involved in translation (DUF1610 family)
MAFNQGRPYHGSVAISCGHLTGTTDTDYFYFLCPKCGNRHIMRVLDYEVRAQATGGTRYPDIKPKQPQDFILALKLYCPRCKLTDFVKIGNVGWQGGQLPAALPEVSN